MPALPIAKAPLVGGRLCLDFTNTAGGWTASFDLIDDRLNHYADLVAWSRYVKLINNRQAAGLRAEGAPRVLARARLLRLAIYRVCSAVIGHGKVRAEDVACLDEEARRFRGGLRFVFVHGRFEVKRTAEGLDCMLGPVAQSAVDLLTSDATRRVRMCPGESCGWLFEDSSRNHTRHWCDMKMCGNVAKVRRFRERVNDSQTGR
jgi:predicted RNA-binding Zn ribbon-like protein